MKKLVVFFDGTWNTPEDKTNVHALYKLLQTGVSTNQECIYIEGVGTQSGGLFDSAFNFLGGAFGSGLDDNILEGYRWLVGNYQENDQIFLFGFSRGAYSARSLAGLIRNSGILRREHSSYLDEAYELYRDDLHPDTKQTKEFRQRFSFECDIQFIGVWDTVGSLGIPVDGLDLPGFNDYYKFHDTKLSSKVKTAYHALAINECRSPYVPTLWTKRGPSETRPPSSPVEQRWFIGAHSNVGGGYPNDMLCNLSCRWIQKMAQRHGLEFLSDWPVGADDFKAAPRDSFTEFMTAHPQLEEIVTCKARPVGRRSTVNETIDPSVVRRFSQDPSFLKKSRGLRKALQKLPVGED